MPSQGSSEHRVQESEAIQGGEAGRGVEYEKRNNIL